MSGCLILCVSCRKGLRIFCFTQQQIMLVVCACVCAVWWFTMHIVCVCMYNNYIPCMSVCTYVLVYKRHIYYGVCVHDGSHHCEG